VPTGLQGPANQEPVGPSSWLHEPVQAPLMQLVKSGASYRLGTRDAFDDEPGTYLYESSRTALALQASELALLRGGQPQAGTVRIAPVVDPGLHAGRPRERGPPGISEGV
jgi:hypothetical protein